MSNVKYLRVIVNNECNLSCFFCHKEGTTCNKIVNKINSVELIQMISLLIECGIEKIKFLGGEPTLCESLPDIVSFLKLKYPSVDISMVTNGIFSNLTMQKFINAGIDRINVSLHGFDGDVFKKVTRGNLMQLNQTISNIEKLNAIGKLGKINYVLLKGVNENEFINVLNFVNKNKVVLDVLNYLGTNEKLIDKYYYSFDEILDIIKRKFIVNEINTFKNKFSLPSTRVVLESGGIINLKTTKLNSVDFLKSCNCCEVKKYCIEGISAIRLTSSGLIKPCIFRADNIFNLREALNENTDLEVISQIKNYLENL